MNLYLRLLSLLLRAWLSKHKHFPILKELEQSFRCWPHDCDANMHLTNSRYLGFGDLGRINAMLRTQLGRIAFKQRLMGVVNAQTITYIRPINPLQGFTLHSRLLGWDEKYWYFEHRFMVAENLCATLMVRGVFLKKGKVLPMEQLLAALDEDSASPQLPQRVAAWKQLLAAKRQEAA